MDSEAQRWKDEYRALLNEQEQQATDARELQALLRGYLRAVLGACRGWQEHLDEEIEVLLIKLDQARDATTLQPLHEVVYRVTELVRDQRQRDEATATLATSRLEHALDELGDVWCEFPMLAEPLAQICQSTTLSTEQKLTAIATTVLEVCQQLERERRDTEAFLLTVQQSLGHFETWTQQATGDYQHQRAASSALQQQVDEDVNALTEAVTGDNPATDDLKTRLLTRIKAIGDRISVFRDTEEARIQDMESRNAALHTELETLRGRADELDQQLRDQQDLLLFDSLTKVHSRYAYEQRIAEMLATFRRDGSPFCYALWDIDHFKRVNDSLGHQAGDVLLAQVAGYLQRYTRSGDFVARLGGEEFVVLLPSTIIDDAMRIADKLRALIAAASFDYDGDSHAISLSCGIAAIAEDDSAVSLYKRADEALYAAKDAGRNRCIAA